MTAVSTVQEKLVSAAHLGFAQLLEAATYYNIDFYTDPRLTFILLNFLQQIDGSDVAAHVVGAIADRHSRRKLVVRRCALQLHRLRKWQQALELCDQVGDSFDQPPGIPLRLVKADCLFQLKAAQAARMLIVDMPPQNEKVSSDITSRILSHPCGPLEQDVEDCTAAFLARRWDDGYRLFQQIVRNARSRSVTTPVASAARDRETEAFSNELSQQFSEYSSPKSQILLLSDSIAMPRPLVGVDVVDTYPFLVNFALRAHKLCFRLAAHSRRGETIPNALRFLQQDQPRRRAIVIQIGLVDCFPRILRPMEAAALKFGRKSDTFVAMHALARAYRPALERDASGSAYVPLTIFVRALRGLIARAKEIADDVFLTTIITPARHGTKEHLTPVGRAVASYNQAIRSIASRQGPNLIDLDEQLWARPEAITFFVDDNCHLSRRGHKITAEIISGFLVSQHN